MTVDLYDLRRAWVWLGQRVSLGDAAARLNLKPAELDKAIWDWRAAVAAAPPEHQRTPEELARLRRLAPFDKVAAAALAAAEQRAAA